MTHKSERAERAERGKAFHGQITYELWHMKYSRIKIKNKAEREEGQNMWTNDIRVWFHSLLNHNIVWFLYAVKWFPPCYYSCSLRWNPVDMQPWETLDNLILLWRLLCFIVSFHMFFTTDGISSGLMSSVFKVRHHVPVCSDVSYTYNRNKSNFYYINVQALLMI